MKVLPTVYIETSVVSYLTARPSRDVLVAGQQGFTRVWWEEQRASFDAYISDLVVAEAAAGDAEAAQARLAALREIPRLESGVEVQKLAESLLATGKIPMKAADDAEHVAYAAVYGIETLLTWNCRHIANPAIQRDIAACCEKNGFVAPVLCTPYQLLRG